MHFDLEMAELFAARESDAPGKSQSVEASIGKLFKDSGARVPSSEELPRGFYRQYKRVHRPQAEAAMALVHVSERDGAVIYKRRMSAAYCSAEFAKSVGRTFEGAFFVINRNLVMIDYSPELDEMTFHSLMPKYYFDTDIKWGMQMRVGSPVVQAPSSSRFALIKVPDTESILSVARQQGLIDLSDVREEVKDLLGSNSAAGNGVLLI